MTSKWFFNRDKMYENVPNREEIMLEQLTQVEKDIETLKGNNGQGNVDTQARADIKKLQDMLAGVFLSVVSFGAKGDGATVDNSAIDAAITALQGKRGILFFPPTTTYYKLTKDFTIPEGVSLVGNGSVISNSGKFTLSGKNVVKGIIFDGKWSTGGVDVRGADCYVYENEFLNTKQSQAVQGFALNVEKTSKVRIFNNKFDGVKAYDEALTGQSGSISRAVRIANSSDVVVRNNTFDNMDGYADSDYIHVIGSDGFVADTTFPYNGGAVKGYYTPKTGIIIRENVFYYAKCKSAVKIQESGVQVVDNTFYVDSRFSNDTYHNIIRFYNVKGISIKGNTFVVDSSYLTGFISGLCGTDVYVSDNKVKASVEILSTLTNIQLFSFSYMDGVQFAQNKVDVFAVGTMFYLDAVKNAEFTKNDMFLKASTGNVITIASFKQSAEQVETDTVTFAGNTITGDSGATEAKFDNIGSFRNVVFEDNVFKTLLYSMRFTVTQGLHILRNRIRVKPIYFLTLATGTFADVKLMNNIIDNSAWDGTSAFVVVRAYQPITGMVYSKNDLLKIPNTAALYVFMNNSNASQNNTEVFYATGNCPAKVDSGATADRNPYKKAEGFSFNDKTLGKVIWWDGAVWKDATGTTV
jgi:hypothetical protein